jgi:hypothetical protein
MDFKIRKHTAKEANEKALDAEKAEREFRLKNNIDVEFFINDKAKDAMLIFKLNGIPVKYNIFRDIYKLCGSDSAIDNLINAEFEAIKNVIPAYFTKANTKLSRNQIKISEMRLKRFLLLYD